MAHKSPLSDVVSGRVLICGVDAFEVRQHVQDLGYQCGVARSAAQALLLAVEEQPDVVLIDVDLKDGMEAAGRLRDAAVVFIASEADHDTLQRARLLEPYGCLRRPFDARELQTVLSVALYRRRLERQTRTRERELRMREEALQHAQRVDAFGRLAGDLAHDFNNLLSAIGGHAELLLLRLAREQDTTSALDAILVASKRATELTRKLLGFSGKRRQEPGVLDVHQQLQGTQKLMGPLFGACIDVQVQSDESVGKVLMDATHLDQVILNLLINARDAMPTGGRIVIEAANSLVASGNGLPAGEYVTIGVRDNGMGMDENVMARLFEPFFTTKPPGHGTGLGLSIVTGIIEEYHGKIEVESTPGVGTEFRIYLPRCDGAPERAESAAGQRDGDQTVLVVENNDLMRTFIKLGLQRSGYRVLESAQPGDALFLARQHQGPIHVLLADVILPRITGADLAARLQQDRPEIRTLLMTAGEIAVLPAPALPLVRKPFSHLQLADCIRQVLRDSSAD